MTAGGRAVSEPNYSQRSRSVCVSLSAFFHSLCIPAVRRSCQISYSSFFFVSLLSCAFFFILLHLSYLYCSKSTLSVVQCINNNNEKALRDAKHCAPAVVPHRRTESAMAVVRQSQKFIPAADPLPGGAGPPKFNQLEMVTTCTYRPSLVKIDARNFELSW